MKRPITISIIIAILALSVSFMLVTSDTTDMVFPAVSTTFSHGFVEQHRGYYPLHRDGAETQELIVQRFFIENQDKSICPFELAFPNVSLPGYETCAIARPAYLAIVTEQTGDPTQVLASNTHVGHYLVAFEFKNEVDASGFVQLLVEQLNVSPLYPASEIRTGFENIGSGGFYPESMRSYHHTGLDATNEEYINTLLIIDQKTVLIARTSSEEMGRTYSLSYLSSLETVRERVSLHSKQRESRWFNPFR